MDACIIGAANRVGKGAAIYCSGACSPLFAALGELGLQVVELGPEAGQASGFKMLYAGFTKGVSSLLLELLLAAKGLGLAGEIEFKYRENWPGLMNSLERNLPGLPFRAKRRAEEMRELSLTLKSLGLESHMAGASARVLELVAGLAPQLEREYGRDGVEGWDYRRVLDELYRGLAGKTAEPGGGATAGEE